MGCNTMSLIRAYGTHTRVNRESEATMRLSYIEECSIKQTHVSLPAPPLRPNNMVLIKISKETYRANKLDRRCISWDFDTHDGSRCW